MIFFSLMLLVAYSFTCLSLGLVLLRIFIGRDTLQTQHAPSARVVSGFLFGSAVLANVWLGLSLLPGKWFTVPIVGIIVLASAVVGAIPAVYALRDVVKKFVLALRNTFQQHWFWGILAIASLVFPLLYGLAAALPPRSDASSWYFALPKLLAFEGVIRPLPGYEFFSQLGLHGELHTAVLILLGSPQAATLFAGFIGIPAVMMLIEIARQAGVGRLGRWTLFLLTYTSSAFVFLTFAGRLDLFGVALSLAAVYWALQLPLRGGVLVLIGLLGCFGVLAKVTYALTTVPILAVLLVWRSVLSAPTGCRFHSVFRAGALCFLGAMVAFVPHVVKNVVLYGSGYALSPFISPAEGYAWTASKILTDAQAFHVLWSWPVALFLGQFPGMFGSMTVAILAFWPMVLLLPRPKRFLTSTLVQLSIVGLMGAIVFVLMEMWSFSLRYFIPALLLLTLAPAAAVEYVWNTSGVRRILKIGVAIVLVMTLAERFNRPKGHPGKGLKYVLGRITELQAAETSVLMCQVVNNHAQPGDRVYLGTKYPYFLKPEFIASASSSDERDALAELPDPVDRWRKLYDDGNGFRFICIGPLGGKLHEKDRGFELIEMYGSLRSDTVPEDLELVCRYWGPGQPKPNGYAVFELRPKLNEDAK